MPRTWLPPEAGAVLLVYAVAHTNCGYPLMCAIEQKPQTPRLIVDNTQYPGSPC